MAKVYMVRHQRGGVLTSHVFLAPPTEVQLVAMTSAAHGAHGATMPAKGDRPETECWTSVVEAELLGEEIPTFAPPRTEEASLTPAGSAGVGTVG